jgi:hypothetical protein
VGIAGAVAVGSYWQPSGGQALVALRADIRRVLGFAETIMRLDFWAHGRLADAQRASAKSI